MRVKFLDLQAINASMRADIDLAISGVIDSGWFVRGAAVETFEESFAGFVGAGHCVGVGNGLDALRLSLLALGVGPGDDVLVPSHTFIATWLAVTAVGARPVPVDPDPATFLVDAARFHQAGTPATKAVIPVDLYGRPCDLDAIMEVATESGWVVVEDAAQAHGATRRGAPVGSGAHAVAWSFYPGKNLGALGDAGAVTTDDPRTAERVRTLANYGSKKKYHHDEQGFNSRLDELQGAVLEVKLRSLEAQNARRRQIAQRYAAGLSEHPALRLPTAATEGSSSWHLFVVRADGRDKLADHLAASGVETLIHYPQPPHRSGAYREAGWQLPVADELADTVLSLPIGPHLTDEQVDHVIDASLAWRG